MKKIGLFLIVLLFSAKSEAGCPHFNDKETYCQIAKGTFFDGKVAYNETYCTGDFPYCEVEHGDCCSENSFGTGIGERCCDPAVYVRHKVKTIEPGGVRVEVGAYKCCSIAEYGKDSTYYFDKEERAHCCGGQTYKEKSSDEFKTCCNPKFDSEGNITHYHTVVDVMGYPNGETEKICCEAKGDKPGEYRQTAYWNGGAHCCDGKTHKTGKNDAGNETYACCVGSKGKNKTHKVVEDVLGAPNGEEACCSIESYGKSPTGYWNGSSAQCCKGKARKNGVDSDGQVKYACCEGDTAENPTQKKVSVLDAPNGEETCCDIATYGANPTAYWNGSSAVCCKGEAKKKTDGTYVCCPVVDSCPDGSTPTPNHVDDIEGTCGSVCCKVKADYSDVYYDEWDEAYPEFYSGWTIAGATNGKCCSGYTYEDVKGAGVPDFISNIIYEIKNNNGGWYCAESGTGTESWPGDDNAINSRWYYPSVSKWCGHSVWTSGEVADSGCYCAEKGDPQNGSECD